MSTSEQELKQEARRRLNNLRGVVRRKHTTGWVDRSAEPQFATAFAAVVAYEDAAGVEAAAELSDRLTALRQEAMAAGLLSARGMIAIEREVAGNA